MQVVIFGSGNTATALGRLIKKGGHEILQVFSRSFENAEALASEFNCLATSNYAEVVQGAKIYLVALSDSALINFHQNWHTAAGLVVHTAGSVSKDILAAVSENYGVLYPLQSLRKEKLHYKNIPLLTDANSVENLTILTDFAKSLSGTVSHADDEGRMHLHLGAIVVNNFSNYLFTLAEDYCKKNGVDFKLLQPLIEESAERLSDFSPAEMQTGPAARGDMSTIDKHIQLLQNFSELQELYQLFTHRIMGI